MKILKKFDWKSTLMHVSIFLVLYLCMSISENIDFIKDIIVNHIGTTGATVITAILSTFLKKVLDAIVAYLANPNDE